MLFSLWLGMVIAAGESGCTTIKKQEAVAQSTSIQARRAIPVDVTPTKTASAPIRGLRNPDYNQVPKVPPPGARVVYTSVQINQPYIAITFDDGPHVTNTPRLLNMLKERNIKATFFVVGQCAKEYPSIIRRILAEGHEIGSHTYTHRSLPTLSEDTVRQEITKTDAAVTEAANYHMRVMRPPYGATNLRIKKWFYDEFGYPTILWDVDPFDWKKPGASVVKSRIVSGTRNGSIILCHDIHAGTIDAMPDTLDTLLAKGFHFVTVSQLLNMEQSAPATASAPALKAEPVKMESSPATGTPAETILRAMQPKKPGGV
jgi:peptidoglycan/xylan/chitin deacetylase (PgdA/CDA1 family)